MPNCTGEPTTGWHDCFDEKIVCPECRKICKAVVRRTYPAWTYTHSCEHCNHMITEDEWKIPKGEYQEDHE